MIMEKFHVATYDENEKKFVIVDSYDNISHAIKEYGIELLTRGASRTMLLKRLDVNIEANVTVLNNE
jgi:hypothetical protein